MPTFEELLREAKRPSENNFNSMLASIKSTARNQPWEDADYMTNTTGLTPDFYTGGAQPQVPQPEPTPMQPHFIQPEDVAEPSTDPSDLLFQTRIGSPEEDRASMADTLQIGQDLKNSGIASLYGGLGNVVDAGGYATDTVGLSKLSDWIYGGAEGLEQKSAEYQQLVKDPKNLAVRAVGSLSALPMMAPALVAGWLAPAAALPFVRGMLGVGEAAGEAGRQYRHQRAAGKSHEEARTTANRQFLTEAPLDILSEKYLGVLGTGWADKLIRNPVARGMLGESIQEGLQETYQGLISNAVENAAGKNLKEYGNALLDERKNAIDTFLEEGIPAMIGSAFIGAAGGAGNAVANQSKQQSAEQKQTIANVQKVQEAFANAAQAGHVYTAPGTTENVGTATAAAPMPSTTGTGFEGVDISKGFSPTTTTTATLPGQLVPQGLSDIANPSQGTISTAGYPLPGVIPTTAPTTPSGKPQQTVTQGNAAQVGQAIATTPQPAGQPTVQVPGQVTGQVPGQVTRVPVSVRGGTDENGNFVLGSDVGDAIRTLIGINGQQPTQSPQAPAQRPAAPANISRVVTPDGNTEIETHYAVVPAESLITSNTPDFGVNQAYPAELQPRDRTRTANQSNVMNITRNLDPARLADSRLTSEGAPIVDANGVVESGNGRTLALMRGYRDGAQTMQGYRQYLLDNAARLGLDPAQVASVQNPVLVRVRDTQMTPEQRVAFANASNRSSIAGMSATEQARMDAGNLTNDILSQYNIEQPPSSTGQRNFHQAFLATIPENERGQLIDSKGQPTQALIRREQNALVYAATGDEQLAERMTESTDDNVRIVSNAIVQAAPTLARLNSEMRAGNLRGEYGIASDIATAANKLSQLRNEGQKVEDFLGQRHIFSDLELSEEALTLLEAFDKNKRYANRIRDALLNYARSVEMLGGPNEQNLFEDVTPPSKMDLLRAALDRAMSGEGTQGTLFDNRDMMYIGQKGARNIDSAAGLKYEDKSSRMYNNWIAEQMEKEGKDARTILQATGWQRLKDGHWRYELPDGTFTPVPGTSAVTKSLFKVGDVYDDKQLFDAYPDLKNIPLFFKNLGPNIGGYVGSLSSTGERVIVINTNRLNLKTRVLNINGRQTLLHELQHMVQGKEGFASGGDDAAGNAAFKRQYGDRIARLDDWLYKNLHENMFDWKSGTGALGEAQIKRAYYAAALTNDSSLSEAEKQLAQKRISEQDEAIAAARETLKEVYSDLDEQTAAEARRMEPEAAHVYGLQRADTYFKYWVLGGENEARNTANRLGKSMSERLGLTFNDTADIADESTITHDADSPSPPLRDPNPAPKPAPKPAPTTGGFFGGQGTFGFGDGGGTQGTLFNRKESTVQTAKQIAAEVQDVRKQLVEDLKAAGRDEQSAKAEAQLVAAYFGRTANEARKAGMALSVRDQYERFKVEQGIAPQSGENVYEQPERDLTQTQEFKKWFGKSKAVDENGNPQVFYHGTPDGSFDEFRPGAYFTSAKEYADRYQNPSASSISTGKQAVNPKTYAVYLKTEKPFTLSDPKARRIFINEYIKGGNALGINPYLSNQEYAKIKSIDWTEGEDLKDFLQENGYDYDSILLDEGGDPDGSGGVKRRGNSYLVFSPEQIKSVSNRGTFDSSANIYHQTAAPRTQDQTQTPEFKRWFGDSKVVDENGAPKVMYHVSGAKDIQEFYSAKSSGLIYFADSKKAASKAARSSKYTYPVYIKAENPVNTPDTPIPWYRAEDNIQAGKWRREGKDSVYVKDEAGVSLAVFSPEQIKSVNNRGTFDSSGNIYNQPAWHGSPHVFDKFDLGAIGTGEGAQVHGWGLYFAQNREISEEYRHKLVNRGGVPSYAFKVDGKPLNESVAKTLESYLGGHVLYQATEEGNKQALKDGLRNAVERLNRTDWTDGLVDMFQSQIQKIKDNPKLSITAFLQQVPADEKYRFQTIVDRARFIAKNEHRKTTIADVLSRTEQTAKPFIEEQARKREAAKLLSAIDPESLSVSKGGSLFEVDVPENDVLLNEQKPFKDQPEVVQNAYLKLAHDIDYQAYKEDVRQKGGEAAVRQMEKLLALPDIEENTPDAEANKIMAEWQRFSDMVGDDLAVTLPFIKEKIENAGNGRQMYQAITYRWGGPKEASLELNDNGVKGITYVGGRDGRCFVVFDDKAVRTIERYNQEVAKDTPQDYSELRGQISFMDTGEATRDATITLFNSDRSTFVHEVGHKMLDDLVHLGQNPDAGAVFKQDLQVAMDWLGVKNASDIGTEQHERFARAFERYLMEGEAPTSKLAEVFEHFKQWLIDIYRNVANLDVELSPEVRDLFDRLLGKETATETRQSATITGPALAGRGAAFQTQQGRDYSIDYATTGTQATPTPTSASVKKSRATIREIFDRLREIRPVRKGVQAPKEVLGYTDPQRRVARTRWYGDWVTATHEIGHIVDYQLKLRQKVDSKLSAKIDRELQQFGLNTSPPGADAAYLRKEGIAEFFRLYAILPDLAEQAAPEYSKLFQETLADDPDLKSKVDGIFEVSREYWALTPEEKIRAGLRQGDDQPKSKGIVQKVINGWEQFREQFDDRLRRIEKIQNVMRDRAVAEGRTNMLQNGQLKDEYAPYDMFRTAPGFLGKAKRDIQAIMDPIMKIGTEAYDSLVSYMTAKRAIDYWNNDMEPGIATNRQQTEDFIAQFEKDHGDLVKISQDIAKAYEDMVRRTMIDSGVWSEAQYEAYKKKWPNYVPFLRVSEDGQVRMPGKSGGNGVVNLDNHVKQAKGVKSEHAFREIEDPYESMVKNILTYHKIAEKNRVGQSLVAAAEADPSLFADLIEPIKPGERSKDSFYVWKDGKRQWYAADKDILDAITSLEEVAPDNIISKVATKAANALKLGATRANPAFIITNFIRDAMYSTMTNSGWGVPFYNTVKGMAMQLSKDPKVAAQVAEALDSGLAYSGITELGMNSSRESVARSIKKAIGDDGFYAKFANSWVGKFINGIGETNELIELAPKFAEYQRLVKQGFPKRYAARMAREVNIDFSRGGSVGKAANRYIAFFNPAIQGVSKISRTAAANPGKFLAKTALYVMLPSLISWAMGHDDDEYKRMSRSIKDRYWVFKGPGGTWVRIAKPDLVGLVGSTMERMLDKAADKDPAAFRGLGTSIKEAAFPSYMPTVLGPIMEHISNRNFFYGETLIPQSLQNLPPEMQYQKNTSSTAKFLGKMWGISPIIIDNYIKGYGGGVAETIAKAPDLYDQYVSKTGEEKKIGEMPIISRFTVDPYRSSESISRFYDLKRQTDVAKNGFKALAKQGERGEVNRDVRAAKMFEKAGKQISDWNKDIARIREAKNLTPEQKRQRIDRINLERNRLAEKVLAKYDAME